MTITPDSVRTLLHSEDYGDRIKAVNQLRQLDPAAAFDMVQLAAHDSNARVRYAAISQLATLGRQDLATVEPLLRRALTNDPEADVQAAAADAIAGLGLRQAYPDLAAVYHSSTEWLVQFSIVAALGELGAPEAFPLLESALKSDNELVVTAAIGALGELGDDRAVPILVTYTSHPDWQLRHRLVQALAAFKHPEAKAALNVQRQEDYEIVAPAASRHLVLEGG